MCIGYLYPHINDCVGFPICVIHFQAFRSYFRFLFMDSLIVVIFRYYICALYAPYQFTFPLFAEQLYYFSYILACRSDRYRVSCIKINARQNIDKRINYKTECHRSRPQDNIVIHTTAM